MARKLNKLFIAVFASCAVVLIWNLRDVLKGSVLNLTKHVNNSKRDFNAKTDKPYTTTESTKKRPTTTEKTTTKKPKTVKIADVTTKFKKLTTTSRLTKNKKKIGTTKPTTTVRPATTVKQTTKRKKITFKPSFPPFEELEWLDMTEGKQYADYGDGTCGRNKHKPILIKLLNLWNKMAREHNIIYFLSYGTLLGAFRNADVIPYDSDLDLYVDYEQIPLIQSISDKRNFSSSNGVKFVVQEDWRKKFGKRIRKRCDGKTTPYMVDECSFQDPLARLFIGNHHLELYHIHFFSNNATVFDPLVELTWEWNYVFPLRKCYHMGVTSLCPNKPKKILEVEYSPLQPTEKCKNGTWVRR